MLHRSKYAKGRGWGGGGGGGEEGAEEEQSPNPALACPLLKTQVRIIKSPHAAGLECFQKVTLFGEPVTSFLMETAPGSEE